jgi:hypothetical protein
LKGGGYARRSSCRAARTSRPTPAWPAGTGGWPDNDSCRNLLAWSWSGVGAGRHLVVVNFSAEPAQGRIGLGGADLRGRGWTLTDLLDDRVFGRNGDELADHGLFVDLPPWGCHLLAVEEDLDHA